MIHTRENPSPRYRSLLALYQEMHEKGDVAGNLAPEQTFSGTSLAPHVPAIKSLVQRFGSRTLLDYGAGKGEGYSLAFETAPDGSQKRGLREIWGLADVRLYDPGFKPHSELPAGKFDAVVSTDVLEHCPEEDMPWILNEMFGFARQFVFMAMAMYPSEKRLPTGDNAHITVKSAGWWVDQATAAAAKWPSVRYFITCMPKAGRPILVEG